MKSEDQDDLRIAQHAAMWLIRLKSEGPSCHGQFSRWIMESSRHVKAFLLVSFMSSRLNGLDPGRQLDVDALISQAKDCVVPLTWDHTEGTWRATAADSGEDSEQPQSKTRKRLLVGTAAALVAAVVFWGIPTTQGAETYQTKVGEQRSVKLKDGSLIYLNTNSQVQINYTAAARDVRLLKGQALFTVEQDLSRPFRVSAGTAVVRSVGTEFDVYLQPARTLIAVVHGEVVLLRGEGHSGIPRGDRDNSHAPARALLPAARLVDGERASVDLEGQIRQVAQRDVQLAQNWTQRRLVFEEETLADVAAEFNRYNREQIVVVGSDLRARPISGIFRADHPQTLLLFLQKGDGRVVVDKRSDKFVIRFRSPDPP